MFSEPDHLHDHHMSGEGAERHVTERLPSPTGRVARWLDAALHHRHGYDPGAYDERFTRDVERKVGFLYGPGCYFDVSIDGLEHVPDQPVMMVCNHSGGTVSPDIWGLAISWYRHFGFSRPLYILAHELLFTLPFFARLFERVGALRASHEVARRILGGGHDVLVYPGGDLDVWRPYSERYRVDFHGRTGFARLAQQLNVPLVPVAHAGSHEGLRVLTSGRAFARAVGLKRIARVEIWPVALMLPWGLALGPLPHLPPPGKYRYAVGEPIDPKSAETPALLASTIEAAVQQLLERLEQASVVH